MPVVRRKVLDSCNESFSRTSYQMMFALNSAPMERCMGMYVLWQSQFHTIIQRYKCVLKWQVFGICILLHAGNRQPSAYETGKECIAYGFTQISILSLQGWRDLFSLDRVFGHDIQGLSVSMCTDTT